MSGTRDKIEGKAKEGWGKATGDDELESEGKGQHAVGSVKDAAKDVKEKVEDTAENVKHRVAGR